MRLSKLFHLGRRCLAPVLAGVPLFAAPMGVSAFDATLEGQSKGSSSWKNGTLSGYIELDRVACRVSFTGGPATNQVVVLQFDHSSGVIPEIQDLNAFTNNSSNVQITSGPTLSAPSGQDVWSYTFTVTITDNNDGYARFRARLASGCHLSSQSSFKIQGPGSLGTLKIENPGVASGVPDLVVLGSGPASAAPGDIITYTLDYLNKTNAPKGADRSQLSIILPPEVTYIANSATAGGGLVGNTLTWDLPDHLDEGQTGTVTYQVQVNPGLPFGQTFSGLAQIFSSENDLDYSDNSFSLSTTVVYNRAPSAGDDTFALNEDEILTVPGPGVLANDSDPDGNTLIAGLVAGPSHGQISLFPDGSFIFVPATNYNGLDSFTYLASDGLLESAIATVTLTINPVNDAPLVVDDAYSTDEDHSFSVSAPGVLANDSDVEGSPITAILLAGPSHGTLLFNTDGSFTYTPATSYFGTDSFTYQANDGLLGSAPATVRITVRRVNVPPTVSIISPTNGTFYFAPADIVLVAEAFDVDGTISRVDFFQGTNLLAQTNLAAHYLVWTNVPSGTYQFTARATDNDGATGLSAPISVTVLERPPFLTLQPVHFNPQTGLFEEIVRVSNPSQKSIDGVRVLVTNLRSNVSVFNASGKTNGISFVQTLLAIPAGTTVDLRVEFYVPDFQLPNPTLTMEVVPPSQPAPAPDGKLVPVTRRLRLADGSFLLEFTSASNRIYFVQYSADMLTWKTAWPSISGAGTRSQWVDNGPPRTECLPPSAASRFYRVVLAP